MYFIKYDDETLAQAIESHGDPNGFKTKQEALDEAEAMKAYGTLMKYEIVKIERSV